jgi:hypothetical protein
MPGVLACPVHSSPGPHFQPHLETRAAQFHSQRVVSQVRAERGGKRSEPGRRLVWLWLQAWQAQEACRVPVEGGPWVVHSTQTWSFLACSECEVTVTAKDPSHLYNSRNPQRTSHPQLPKETKVQVHCMILV